MLTRMLAVTLAALLFSGCAVFTQAIYPERKPLNATADPKTRAAAFETLRSIEARQASEDTAWQDAVKFVDVQANDEESLAAARARALDLKRQYEAAFGDHAKLNALMGAALIPLTAAAIGLGATGGSPTAVIALGLTGAAGYGTAAWLQSRPRQAAYVAGVKAITCAEDAVKPLDWSIAERVHLQSDITSLAIMTGAVEAKAGEVSAFVDVAQTRATAAAQSTAAQLQALAGAQQQLLRDADAHVDAARALVPGARDAQESGARLQHEIGRAGGKLATAVDNIAAEVLKLVGDAQPDPAALANIINSLGGSYKMFTTVPGQLQPAAADKPKDVRIQSGPPKAPKGMRELQEAEKQLQQALLDDQDVLKDLLRELYVNVGKMSAYRRAVAARVNPLAEGAHFERLKSCGVTVDTATQDITLDPVGPYEFTQGKSGARILKVKGGTSGFDARLAAGTVKGVTIETSPPLSRTLSIKVGADAEAGEHSFAVTDLSGRSGGGTIKVAPAKAADDKPKPPAEPTGDTKDLEDVRTALMAKPNFSLDGASYKVKTATVQAPAAAGSKPTLEVELEVSGQASRRPSHGELVDAMLANAPAVGVADQVVIKNSATFIRDLPVADGGVSPESGEPRRRAPMTGFGSLSTRERQQIQLALCLTGKDVDGVWGPITRGALEKYQQGRPPQEAGVLTPAIAARLLSESNTRIAQRCGLAGR